MKTSKKLLSLFLAVVMVITTCSVGFVAFAKDTDTNNSYWNDSTDAEAAFESLNSLVDYFVPTILNIQIDETEGTTLGSYLGISSDEIKDETLSDVVKDASPLLLGLLNGSGSKEEIIKNALGVDSYSKIYDLYYSYLDGDESDSMSFYDLYQFCQDYTDSSNAELAQWCTTTLEKLNVYLAVCKKALSDISSAASAYSKLKNSVTGVTLEEIEKETYNGVAIKDLDGDDYAYGVKVASAYFKDLGISSVKITNPAEALYYYYSNSSYIDALVALKTAEDGGAKISTKAIGGADDEYITASNHKKVLDKYLDASAKAQYVQEHQDLFSLSQYYTSIGYDSTLPVRSDYSTVAEYNKAVKAKRAENTAKEAEYNTLKASDDFGAYAAEHLPDSTFYSAFLQSCISDKDEYSTYNVYGSSAYSAMTKATLEESGLFDDVDSTINNALITDKQIEEAAKIFHNNDELRSKAENVRAYLNGSSGETNYFSEEASQYLLSLNDTYLVRVAVALSGYVQEADGNYDDSVEALSIAETVKLFKNLAVPTDNTFNVQGCENIVELVNMMIPSVLLINATGCLTINNQSCTANSVDAFRTIFEYNNIIAPYIKEQNLTYSYSGSLVVPDEYSVDAVNEKLNSVIESLFDESSDYGPMINSVIADLLESELTVWDLLDITHDLWKNLANDPMETIFKLLPTLTILVDELIVPMVLNGDGDAYNGNNGVLYGVLCSVSSDAILSKYTLEAGNSSVGISALAFDLNKTVPSILHWLTDDVDDLSEFIEKYGIGNYEDYKDVDGIDANVPKFTGIYVADKAIYNAKIGTGSVDVSGLARTLYQTVTKDVTDKDTLAKDKELAISLDEIITELATFATEAIDEYLSAHSNDTRSNKKGESSQKGLNNLFVALPQVLDIFGKKFIAKYNIDSDWTYCYSGKIYEDSDTGNFRNKTLQDFKALAKGQTGAKVLESFVNILIGNQLDAVLDILNDTFATNDNDITSNIALVQGILDALGGLGEKSVITDVVNGLFQLKRTDDASFTLSKRDDTGFVGFSDESGLFLLANILTVSDDGTQTGLVPFIKGLTASGEATTSDDSSSNSNSSTSAVASVAPLLASSSKATKKDYSDLLSKQNKAAATELIDKLDELLSSLLKNTTLNGFNFASTDSLLSGLVSTVSNYIGPDNTNAIVDLLDDYLTAIVGENKSSSTGKVNKNKLYTSANLSNLVIETYSLVEDIVDYLFYNTSSGLLTTKDPNMLIADALYGIISPDAVSVRMSDSYKNTIKILQKKGNLNWNDLKDKNTDLKYGFSNGSKEDFYDALGESLNGIASVVGVLLTSSYTDSAKSGNYYSKLVYPVLSSIAKTTGASGVMSPSAFNKATASKQLIDGLITPLSNILAELYDAPVTFLLNVVQGLAGVLDDKSVQSIIDNAVAPISTVLNGLCTIVDNLSPTYSTYIKKTVVSALEDNSIVKAELKDNNVTISVSYTKKNTVVSLINSLLASLNVSDYITLPSIDWKKLASAGSPAEVLLLVYRYVVDTVLDSSLIKGLLENLSPEIASVIEKLSATQILDLLNDVLSITQSPTEVYWTFKQYASKLTGTFSYPKNITSTEASNAVDQLDNSVSAVFALLNDLGVTNIDGLSALVNDNLYTNEMLTKLAKAVYGAIDDSSVGSVLEAIGIDCSTKGIAAYLTDKSYGKTYSEAAKTLKKASSWSKVKKLNWGFKDGSAKAETGFINGLAAIFRPFNDVLSILLAEGGKYTFTKSDAKEIVNALKSLNVDQQTFNIAEDSDFGCALKISVKKGVATIVIDSNNSKNNSTLKVNLATVVNDFLNTLIGDKVDFGTNGYESAIIPILEAFMCDGVKTYSQYLKDYKKAKDNLLINILNPIAGLIDDVCDAPFDTVTKILPNVAYFIDSNGIMQAIGNLLAPITASNGLLGVLKKNGLDVDKILKSVLGTDLGSLITDLLDINVKLTVNLNDLSTCNIQDIILPLVKKILKNKNININIPDFDFATIASHGTIKTVKSAAKNDQGKYTTKRVIANQGEVLIAVLRYVSDALIKNATAIQKLICNIDAIKKNDTVKSIIKSVFAQIKTAEKDDIVRAIFYFLTEKQTDKFFDYSNFTYNADTSFDFGELDEDFCRQLAPMLDGLVSGLLQEKGGLNGLVGGLLYTDDIISKLATGLYGAVEGVEVGSIGSLTSLLKHFDIDFSTANVAELLTDETYGETYSSAAATIKKAGSWSKVSADSLSWGVKDRDTFVNALCAVLRPLYSVLDVFLNDSSLNLADIASVPGSDCYTSVIVPLLEAFGCYNIKTQYQYREDMSKEYDAILKDILNPLLDKVEDVFNAPVETIADILPNLSLFFANDGLLQIIENLLTPVSALLEAVRPIVDVNDLLDALGVDLNSLLGKVGLSIDLDIYDLTGSLKPLIGSENVVSLLNSIISNISIKGTKLGIVLPDIDWLKLASHGEYVLNATSQAATIGSRIYVQADQDETLIAVLRFVIETINYKDNYNAIVNLISGLLGNLSESISGVIDQVLGMLQGDTDTVIKSLVDLLQQLAG